MWEIFTEGRMPFEKNSNYEVVTMVTRGHRLHRPKLASKYLYEVMLRCWQEVRLLLCVVFWAVKTIHGWAPWTGKVQFLQPSEGLPPSCSGMSNSSRKLCLGADYSEDSEETANATS